MAPVVVIQMLQEDRTRAHPKGVDTMGSSLASTERDREPPRSEQDECTSRLGLVFFFLSSVTEQVVQGASKTLNYAQNILGLC